MAHFLSESPTPFKCVRFFTTCILLSTTQPLLPPPCSSLQDGNELCNMTPCSSFHQACPRQTHPDSAYMLFNRHNFVLSGVQCNQKAIWPTHAASMVTWHGLTLPLAGLVWLCIGCPPRCLAAQRSSSSLAHSPGLADSGSVRCCLLKASRVTLQPWVSCAPNGLGHKQRRLSCLTPAV